ncbi:MAG: hypothetical protein LBI69_00355 [Puniceicoccales bacterium]|nr:hypothetical protein [Puniceicoccales bacterium]
MGSYHACLGVPNAFSQLSPVVAILPAIALGWILYDGDRGKRMSAFIGGICHRDIITMCLIFLLAGAFCQVTQDIGSIQSMVNLSISLIPPRFLLIGIFLVSAFVSTAIGTSMGTIAAIGPIAAAMGNQTGFPCAMALATVVGGAMFGDNLSFISDTTIAAALSQGAEIREKFKFNLPIAAAAAATTVLMLLCFSNGKTAISGGTYSPILIVPYFFLLGCALCGMNVLLVLFASIAVAGLIGIFSNYDYGFIAFSSSICHGFESMHELMILTMFVGGLSGLFSKDFMGKVSNALATWSFSSGHGKKIAQLLIGTLVSVFDLLLANNTVAIIFCGDICREISQKNSIKPHISATWMSIFSCIFQGIIPYGPQLMLAGVIGEISPIAIMPRVFYCYLLFAGALFAILRGESVRKNIR